MKKARRLVTIHHQIDSCKDCMYWIMGNPWSSDGFDRMVDWFCSHGKSSRKISGAVEWHEEAGIEIPAWCPIEVKGPEPPPVLFFDI